ncbi:MAG: hypothetical protein HYU66_11825 [Armatimonadetes bacterium]|nr:hypothetical protein [Armatimonadota bacterium]
MKAVVLVCLVTSAASALGLKVAALPTVPLEKQLARVTVANPAAAVNVRVELTIKPPVQVARTTAAAANVPAGGSVDLDVPFELFEAGDHAVTVRALVDNAEAATWSGTLTVTGLDAAVTPFPNYYRAVKPDAAKVVTSIDYSNRLHHRGKPWFPIGIYLTPQSEQAARELADAGFDLVCLNPLPPEAVRKYLDAMQGWGLNVWMPVSWSLQFAEGDMAKKKAELQALVAAVGSHPALALWESMDEPAWGGQPAWGLREGYQFLRALDPQRPIWTNHAPRNSIQTLAWYNQGTDIAGCDIYPVPMPQGQSDLPNKTYSVVGDETAKSIASVRGEKPILMVLQGFAWAALNQRDDPKAVYPTFAESRYMAYDAILSGCQGILYWGCHYAPRPSPFWSDLKKLVSELRAMQPVLVTGPMTGRSSATVEPVDGPVRVSLRMVDGHEVLLALNRSAAEAEVRVSVPKTAGKKWRGLFGDPAPRMVGARLALALPAWGVRVLTTDPRWDPRRKDYTAEAAKTRQLRPLVTEAGNAVPNASFDQDDDGDSAPDGWEVRYPFTATLDTEVTHGGRAALRLVADTAEFRPLLVMQHCPTQGNRKYRLTAWLRTDTPGVKARIYAEWVKDGWHSGIMPWTEPTAAWREYGVDVLTTPDPEGNLYVVVQVDGPGRVWFDDVRLSEAP